MTPAPDPAYLPDGGPGYNSFILHTPVYTPVFPDGTGQFYFDLGPEGLLLPLFTSTEGFDAFADAAGWTPDRVGRLDLADAAELVAYIRSPLSRSGKTNRPFRLAIDPGDPRVCKGFVTLTVEQVVASLS